MFRPLAAGLGLLCWSLAAQAVQDSSVFLPAQSKQSLRIADTPNPGGDAVTLNLLAVYSTRFEAQLAAEGHAVADYLQRSYEQVNRFFANTGLRTRLRLAGLQRWQLAPGAPIAQDNAALVAYAEGADALRDAFAADLVQLWEVTEAGIDDPQICGWGQGIGPQRLISTAGFGYSTVARGQAGTAYAGCYAEAPPESIALLVAHEIGHNLGSTHAWGEDSGEGAFDFAHGQLCGGQQGGYPQGTIMSTSGWRLPFFSSPELSRDGQACGTATGQSYPADNRETFTRTAAVIAGLRARLDSASRVSAEMPARVGELNGELPVTLRRSEATGAASLELLVFPETAKAGLDYLAPARQRVDFAPGQYSVTVTLELRVDDEVEVEESLIIWLQQPRGMQLEGGRGFRVFIADAELTALGSGADGLLGDTPRASPLPGSAVPDAEPRSLASGAPSAEASGPSPGGSGSAGAGLLLLLLLIPRRRHHKLLT